MPVYMHLSTLIIQKETLERKYYGGLVQFRIDHLLNEENHGQEDNKLMAIASMNPSEFDIDDIIQKGLHFDTEKKTSSDFVIHSRYGGYLWEAKWLGDNTIFAWDQFDKQNAIDKAIAIGNLTMNDITEMYDRGEEPFATIVD